MARKAKGKDLEKNPGTGSFETELSAVESLIRELQDRTLSLEDSLRKFEEGVRRLRGASAKLKEASLRIEELSKDSEGEFKFEPVELEEEEES